jgi:hypothetical protein
MDFKLAKLYYIGVRLYLGGYIGISFADSRSHLGCLSGKKKEVGMDQKNRETIWRWRATFWDGRIPGTL